MLDEIHANDSERKAAHLLCSDIRDLHHRAQKDQPTSHNGSFSPSINGEYE